MKQTLILFCILLAACSSDDTANTLIDNSLERYVNNQTIETGAVIACSANSSQIENAVEVYFYPEAESANFKLFQTTSVDVNPNDFANYIEVDLTDEPFFNGTLRKFVNSFDSERWVVVTFELDNEIKVSNPIRLKQFEQSTLFSNEIMVNQSVSQMPVFSWNIASEENNAIFFQVLSTTNNDLISGTYTFENQFQYYNTSNVVLNITEGTPPILSQGQTFNFTVMDVSEDNWVNQVLTTQFTVE